MTPPVSSRLRNVAVATATAAAGLGLAIRHRANALRANDQAQQRARQSATNPANLYVSVDRSGGGV